MEQRQNSGKGGRPISLIDLVFSWSIRDVLDANICKAQVKKIPLTFNSTAEYFNSFVAPLIEETHAELLSSMTTLSRAPSQTYEPQAGDLVALTDVRPKCISDLQRPKMSYLLAYVQSVDSDDPDQLLILSSKPILIEQEIQRREKHTLFLVYLMNMTTNLRIWNALHPDPNGGNLKMINKIIQMNGADEEDCAMCLSEKNSGTNPSFKSYGLNDSQEAVITGCINTWRCSHQNTVKLVWGPPGAGKTKTVSLLLCALLRMKCRTITCAPTNIAVVEGASRLVRLVCETLGYDTKIDDLLDICLKILKFSIVDI
ncbi:hypothetical protein PTKIN_Ptkin01aG0279700 [Pterospermum kingtungense]